MATQEPPPEAGLDIAERFVGVLVPDDEVEDILSSTVPEPELAPGPQGERPRSGPGTGEAAKEMFRPGELRGGRPTLAGLRRVAAERFGDVVECLSRVVQAPHPANDGRACVECVLGLERRSDRRLIRVSGVADVCDANTPDPIRRVNAAATAEEEAERRAYLRLLGLDVGGGGPEATPAAEGLLLVDSLAHRLGVNALAAVCEVSGAAYAVAAEVPGDALRTVFDRLSDLQRRKANDTSPASKPEDRSREADRAALTRLAGYDAGWLDGTITKG